MAGSLLKHIERLASRGTEPTVERVIAEKGRAFNTSPKVTNEGLWDYWHRLFQTGDTQTRFRFLRAWVSPGVNKVLTFRDKPKYRGGGGSMLFEPKEKG